MSIDRSDIRLSVKELTRHMAKPKNKDFRPLIHLGRYLIGKPRIVTQYAYKKDFKIMDVWSETDHAGFLETRT